VFGAVLWAVLGLGVSLRRGLQTHELTTLGIHWVLVLVMLMASVVVGILAAALPSIRAVHLNILDAMAHA
jgi:putative ABC transport system permease protein